MESGFMAKVHELVEAELENIERVMAELPGSESLPNLSSLELAGVAALIHNFYNGVENILKHIIVSSGKEVPNGPSWHQDLVNTATSNHVISESTAKDLRRYLAFRHFFSHGYSFDLDKGRVIPLAKDIQAVFVSFRNDINKALKKP
jgi:uncharacterized protein YutE (UPF0331/DUF86 family)